MMAVLEKIVKKDRLLSCSYRCVLRIGRASYKKFCEHFVKPFADFDI